MKKAMLFLLMLFISFLTAIAQNVRVVSEEMLTGPADGMFCCPQMDKSGTRVFFTTPGYRGLYYYHLDEKKLFPVNDDFGAGYEPAINADGNEVLCRTYTVKNGRRFYSIVKFDSQTREKTILEKDRRLLSVPKQLKDGNIVYTLNSELKTDAPVSTGKNKQEPQVRPAVFIEDQKIALFVNGQKRVLEPRGSGSYIWPELSPSGRRLLFKKLGDGCYVSDLEGNIISSLGNINAPHWSPDGKYIVYMADRDDGQKIIASEIHVIKANGSTDIQLTETHNQIELYPRWGNDINTIVYNTEKGQIYLMRLEWK